MKSYRWIIVLILISATGIWIWRIKLQSNRDSDTWHKSTITKPLPNGGISTIRPAKVTKTSHSAAAYPLGEEASRLVNGVRVVVEIRAKVKLYGALSEILDRYQGDPRPLILDLSDLLEHESNFVRISMAEACLRSNLNVEKAKGTLRAILGASDRILYSEETVESNDKASSGDLRIKVANILSLYGIKDASDDIWSLYRNTGDKKLIEYLRRLNDPRMIEELKIDAVKNPGSIESMKLIGEFRFEEALPELRRRYTEGGAGSDLRFRALYPLWRLTGDEKYFDEFATSFLPTTIPVPYLAVGGERERQYLVEMLVTARSDTLYKAVMALHLRYHDDAPVKQLLIGYYQDIKSSNWANAVLARRLVGNIDDPELTKIARDYEKNYPTGNFERDAVYKKDWRFPEWEEALFMD